VYEKLPTEQIPEGPDLDLLAPAGIARLLLAEEEQARRAVAGAMDAIGKACEAAAAASRIVYVGAGTSGRLGVLDAAEMGPTFGAPPGCVVALLAGAPRALTDSVEGVEDDGEAGRAAYVALEPDARDCVVGITMSGTAAYVKGALDAAHAVGGRRVLIDAAHAVGGRRVLITANPESPIAADVAILLDLGAEALAGSTRLKGGSATKAVLNMISTAAMCAAGLVYGNLMVAVRPTNRKLRDRAERIVARVAGVDRDAAVSLLKEAGDDVRTAIVMRRRGISAQEARALLDACGGRLREALP